MYWFVGYRVLLGTVVLILLGDRGGGGGMTVILLRHGRSTSNTAAHAGRPQRGRRPGRQGARAGRRRSWSGSGRCRSARSCARRCCGASARWNRWPPRWVWSPIVDERISEVDYGSWTGRKIGDLVKEPLWAVVQQQPSAAVFPDGEGLAAVQARAVARGP